MIMLQYCLEPYNLDFKSFIMVFNGKKIQTSWHNSMGVEPTTIMLFDRGEFVGILPFRLQKKAPLPSPEKFINKKDCDCTRRKSFQKNYENVYSDGIFQTFFQVIKIVSLCKFLAKHVCLPETVPIFIQYR